MFSLTRGGPFYHLAKRLHLVGPSGRVRAFPLVAVAWLPLAAATIVELASGGRLDFAAGDPTMHVRLLVTLPLLFFAENLLEDRCAGAVRAMRRDAVIERATFDAILNRAEHLRDWWGVETALAIATLALGQIALWDVGGWSGIVSGVAIHMEPTFATLWCVAFALPLVQFLMFRWLWRWLVWTYVIARMSRVSLSLNTLHPDRAGGLKVLGSPIDGFALFVAAIAAIFSAAWTTQIRTHQTTFEHVSPTFFAFAVIAFLVGCGPLLLFAGQLYRARHRDTVAYHGFARRYVDDFRTKWIGEPSGESPVGSNDIQALNDLGGSFTTSEGTKLYPFGTRAVVYLWLGALVPMIPLLLATTPLSDVARRFGKMLFGIAP